MVEEIGIIWIFFPINENCEVLYMYILRFNHMLLFQYFGVNAEIGRRLLKDTYKIRKLIACGV